MHEATAGSAFPAPFSRFSGEVRAEWIDSNDHMNLAYYVVLFDHGTDAIYAALGMGPDYKQRYRGGTFAVETHTLYRAELRQGARVAIETLVAGVDAKRLHLAHTMLGPDGRPAAMQEILFLHVDLETRRVAPWPAAILAHLLAARDAHARLPRPDWLGGRIAMPG
jgi:acyl-CoA thioester hydrolase